MGTVVQLMGNYRYPNILVNRSVSTLFVAICFLIIANTRCDQVGSANAEEQIKQSTTTEDPLSFFREIYLDSNSKIITMIPNKDTVQKFHPNGRYGRSFAEPSLGHSELGRLRFNNNGRHLNSVLQGSLRDLNNKYQSNKNREIGDSPGQLVSNLDSSSSMDYQLEMGKLLKCNFTGVSNLYWCNLDK